MSPESNRLIAYGSLALSMTLTGSYVALSKPCLLYTSDAADE